MDAHFVPMLIFYGLCIVFVIAFAYFNAPSSLSHRFAFCTKCEKAKFDEDWDEIMPLTCKRCKKPMKLFDIPKILYKNRLKSRRRTILLMVPVALSGYLLFFSFIWGFLIWVFIAIFSPLLASYLVILIRVEMSSRREIVNAIKSNYDLKR